MTELTLIFLVFVVSFTSIIYFTQDRMLFFPDKDIRGTPREIGLEYEDVRFRTADDVSISAWYVPAKNERGVLLFCHGNAGNISDRLDSIRIFNGLGLSVLILDYRGYGKSEGKPTERGTYLDADAAWEYLKTFRQKSPEKIVLFGRSLGGAVAAELALKTKPAGLILESTFTSVVELGKKFYPWFPVRLLARHRYATLDKVGAITCPKLIIHSPQDEIVPFGHGKALYEMASPPKEFLEIRGGHNEGFLISGETYTKGLRDFLERIF